MSGQRQGADTWATGSQGRGRGGSDRRDEGLRGREYRGSQEGRQQFEGRGGGGGRVHGSPVRLGGTVEDSRTRPTPGRHALPPGRGEQQPAWSPEESLVTRAQHRATMDELTATFDSSLRNLSTAVEERLARVEDRLGGHERRLQLVERQVTTIEEAAANVGSDMKAQIVTMQLQIKEQGCIIVHTQDLVNSLLQEAEYTEDDEVGRKRPHTTGGKGGKNA